MNPEAAAGTMKGALSPTDHEAAARLNKGSFPSAILGLRHAAWTSISERIIQMQQKAATRMVRTFLFIEAAFFCYPTM
jgi:hypothetical protein